MAKKAISTVSLNTDGGIELATDQTPKGKTCTSAEVDAYRENFLARKPDEKGGQLKNIQVTKRSHTRLVMLASFAGMGIRTLSLQRVLDNILEEHFKAHAPVLKVIKAKTIKATEDELDL